PSVRTPSGIARRALPAMTRAEGSAAALTLRRPTSPTNSPSQLPITTASPGATARAKAGTSSKARPNPDRPRPQPATTPAAKPSASCEGSNPAIKSAQVGRQGVCPQPGDRLVKREDLLLLLAQSAQRDGPFLGLALADHQQVRNLGQRVLAHLVVDLLVP